MCNGVDLSGNRHNVDSLASCVSDAVSIRCKDAIVPLWNVRAAEFCVSHDKSTNFNSNSHN